MPIEIQDLELATGYEMFGRCHVDKEEDLWGEWSPILPFQTPPSAPKDVWIMGNICGAPGRQEPLLLWKASGLCMQVTYRVWIQVKDQEVIQEETPYCNFSIPTQAEWVGVSAVNATSWESPTNLSLTCLGPDFAPHGVVVKTISGNTELLVTWQQEPGELQEHVVDWIRDGDPSEDLNWVRLPPGNLSAVLPVDFKEGVPYRITVTAISPWGLAPAPSVWKFREELVPLSGPVVWRIQDSPSGTPAVAWEEVPRQQLRGHLTHYTLRKRLESQREAEWKKEEERLRLEEEQKEEEERKAQEEQAQREHEEYLKLKETFVVEEEGVGETMTEEQSHSFLAEFINYIKQSKVVLLEDLASQVGLRTQDTINRIQDLLAEGTLTGVIDDRGKFIYITPEELAAVANFIRQRGRVSITELAQASNSLIAWGRETPAQAPA